MQPDGGFEADMIDSFSMVRPMPPRLSMDEYVDFIERSLRQCDPAQARRQKELEERIKLPFSMVEEEPSTSLHE